LCYGNLVYASFFSINILIFVHITGIRYQSFPVEKPFYFVVITIVQTFLVVSLLAIFSIYLRMMSIEIILSVRPKEPAKAVDMMKMAMKLRCKIYESMLSFNKFFSFDSVCQYFIIVTGLVLVFLSTYDFFKNDQPLDSFLLFVVSLNSYMLLVSLILSAHLLILTLIQKLDGDICYNIFLFEKEFSECKKVHVSAELALLQIDHSPLIISCGFVNLDWTIWLTLFTATLTYIIICLQFESSV
jgi:hypothetical protein